MTLSDNTRRALRAYDSFTDFARCPDLLWPPETYERLDDAAAQVMLRAFCYAWAAGQQAANVYNGAIADLADDLFDELATWNAEWTHQRKVDWMRSLGVTSVLLQSDQAPTALAPQPAHFEQPPATLATQPAHQSHAELDTVDAMAYVFTDQCPTSAPTYTAGLSHAELDAIEDMAYFFQIEPHEATLLLQIGRALGKSTSAQHSDFGSEPM